MAPTNTPNVLVTQPDPNAPGVSTPPVPVQNPVVPGNTGAPSTPAAPALPQPPKESFGEGFRRGAVGKTYTTDADGNIISAEPARRTGLGGALGSVLGGALEGLTRGMAAETPEGAKGYGSAASAAAKAAEEGRIAADKRAKALAQQNFENQQKATQAKLEHNLMIAQTHDLIQKSQFAAEEHHDVMMQLGLKNKEDAIQYENTLDQRRSTMADANATLIAHGYQPYASVSQSTKDGKGMAGQAQSHISSMVNGQSMPLHNGQTGDANGANLYSTGPDGLARPFDSGAPLLMPAYSGNVSDGKAIDDKTGKTIPKGQYIPSYTLIQPNSINPATGEVWTGKDIAAQYQAADRQLQVLQTKEAKKMEMEEVGARTKLTNEQADLAAAQVSQLKGMGMDPMVVKPVDNAFTMSSDQLKDALAKQAPNGKLSPAVEQRWDALYGVGHYQLNPSTFPARVYNRPGNMLQMDEQTAATFIKRYINKGYDVNNFDAVKNMEKEFASTRTSVAGGSLIAFRTATLHLGQLAEIAKQLNNGTLRPENAVVQQYAAETGQPAPITFDGVREALAGELGKTFKGAAPDVPELTAIKSVLNKADSPAQLVGPDGIVNSYAHLMLSKAAENVGQYLNYTGFLPPGFMDPQTASVYHNLGIDPMQSMGLPADAQVSVGGTANQHPNQPGTLQMTQPKVGDVKTFPNGARGVWDGHGYVRQ